MKPIPRNLSLIAAAIMVLYSAGAYANESGNSSPAKSGTVLGKVEHALDTAATATEHGIKRGAKAAGHGIRTGMKATAHGIERGAEWTDRTAHKVADKI